MLPLHQFYAIIAIIMLITFNTSSLFSQQKVFFRYNADYDLNSEMQSDIVLSNIAVGIQADDSEETARGTDGWGYNARKVATFHSDSSYILTQTNPTLSVFGTLEISGELWIKIYSGDGVLLSWDDSTKTHGFNLYLQNGKLKLRNRISNDLYELETSTELATLQWYRINWTSKVLNDSVEQAIYIDEKQDVSIKEPLQSTFGFVVLSAPVSLGRSFGNTLQVGNFSGELYAANLKSNIPEDIYLTSPLPPDGSAYFGIAGYHDYPVTSAEMNIDSRISENPTTVDETIYVPYQNDDFIPQGITNSFEDEAFSNQEGMIYISLYNKTPSGQIRLKRSIVVEIDPQNNYQVRRCFRLRGTLQYGHNGGIAYKNNAIYVASVNLLEIYDLPEYEAGESEKYQDLFPRASGAFSVQAKASFVTYYQDSIWSGDYRTSTQQTPYLFGYPLDAQGNVLNSAVPKIYRLPFQTQGVVWRVYNGKKYLFISRSGGDNGSFVYRVLAEDLSRTSLPVIDATFNVPAGGEDLSFNDRGQMLNVSESGAKFFQKRPSPWTTFYPFIFSISESVLFEDVITAIHDNYRSSSPLQTVPGGLSLSAYPNPFNSEITISYAVEEPSKVSLRIYDLLGQEIHALDTLSQQAGVYRIKWNAAAFPSGIYIVQASIKNAIRKTEKIILLK